jgi:phosphoglycerate dehydrogenase-like enzyme
MSGYSAGAMVTAVIIADKDSPNGKALIELLNKSSTFKWFCGNKLEDFTGDPQAAEALKEASLIVPVAFAGANVNLLTDLWPLCPQVKWVHSMAAGVETLVPQMLALPGGKEIPLTNAKGAFSSSLAEYSIAAMLHFNKQITRLQSNKGEKKWEKFIMSELKGMTVGFVGFGDIAQTTVPYCRTFGMKVLALRQSTNASGNDLADKVYYCGAGAPPEGDQKLDLFREADYVICSLPGGSATTHFCNKEAFAAMKPSGVFISIGRGTCVDEKALVDALTNGQIAGAALDVFEKEPLPEDSSVWTCKNLLLSSHNADLTSSYMQLTWDVFCAKLAAFTAPNFAGFDTQVDKDKGY